LLVSTGVVSAGEKPFYFGKYSHLVISCWSPVGATSISIINVAAITQTQVVAALVAPYVRFDFYALHMLPPGRRHSK